MNTELQIKLPQSILILGMGETGLAVARWALAHHISVKIVDSRINPSGGEEWKFLCERYADESAQAFLGVSEPDGELLKDVEMLVLSPGLSPHHPPAQSWIALANEISVPVVGEIELFARALQFLAHERNYSPKILAVTGTNGKTTVTTMVRDMVLASGLTVQAAGNISPSAMTALQDCLDSDTLPQVWVLELSSFQLYTTESLKPQAAAVLNITQDHLDWHLDMGEYIQAKANLLQWSEIAVLNRDDDIVHRMMPDSVNCRTFGFNEPCLVGDLGIVSHQGMDWFASIEIDEFDLPNSNTKRKKSETLLQRKSGLLKQLMPVEVMSVKGKHNVLNALAALSLCRSIGLSWGPLLKALNQYQGQPHRTAFVRTISGVHFIDDSKGTNVGSTVAALDGLAKPTLLIIGGVGKGQDFSPLIKPVMQYVKALVLIGEDAQKIGSTLKASQVEQVYASSMMDAVEKAMALAKPGDQVLLSPACASFDMFKNYHHRGEVFVQAVQELALDRGEVV